MFLAGLDAEVGIGVALLSMISIVIQAKSDKLRIVHVNHSFFSAVLCSVRCPAQGCITRLADMVAEVPLSHPFRAAACGLARAGIIAGLLSASASLAADTPAEEGVRAQQSQAQLQEQIDQAGQATKARLAELRELEDATRSLRHDNARRGRRLAEEAGRQRRLADALSTLEQTRQALPRIEDAMSRQLRAFIRQDMPFLEDERLARVEGDSDALETAEHIRRLLKTWRTELAYGREIDTWRGRLEQGDGTAREVDFLRLGRIGWYYLTPNGREGGVWHSDSDEWQPLSEAARREVRHGLAIAEDKRAPELLTVPLSIGVDDAGEQAIGVDDASEKAIGVDDAGKEENSRGDRT